MKKKKHEKIQWKNQLINFVAIIVGIYIAFWLTNLKEEREQKALELNYLRSLAQDLQNDLTALQSNVDTLAYYNRLLDDFTKRLITKNWNTDSLTAMVVSLSAHIPFFPQDNTYQSMQGSGKLDIIKDFELRQEVVELYNQHYRAVRLADELDMSQKTNLIYPYLMDQPVFSTRGFSNMSLLSETKFINLTFAASYTIRQQYYIEKDAMEKCDKLLKRIQHILANQ
jgi:hypothetical protein